MSDAIKSFVFLIVTILVVHLAYVGYIRPEAEQLIVQSRAAGQSAPPREIVVIIKDYEQEICFVLMFWGCFLLAGNYRRILRNKYLFAVDFIAHASQPPAHDATQIPAHDAAQNPAYDATQLPAYDATQIPAHDATQIPDHDATHVPVQDTTQVPFHSSPHDSPHDSPHGADESDPLANTASAIPPQLDARAIIRVLDAEIPQECRDSPLIRTLRAALLRYAATRSVQNLSDAVESSLEAMAGFQEMENSMIRYLIWAIPSIGFIGTVRGIGLALSQADHALAGNIAPMTGSLGVAFNSTLVALLLSILLMFLYHQLQRLQDGEILETQAYCDRYLLSRLPH